MFPSVIFPSWCMEQGAEELERWLPSVIPLPVELERFFVLFLWRRSVTLSALSERYNINPWGLLWLPFFYFVVYRYRYFVFLPRVSSGAIISSPPSPTGKRARGERGTPIGVGGGCTVPHGLGMYYLIFVGVAFLENLHYHTHHTCSTLTWSTIALL